MALVKNEGDPILRVLCGSRAYGLNDEESDFDYHGVFVVPTSRILGLGAPIKETAWIEGDDQDNTGWELRHFLEMAVQCNPTVLETFVAPVVSATDYGIDLRALFPYVLNRKRIFDAFRGYAKNQRTKMFEPVADDGKYSAAWFRRRHKAGIAYLRSLYHGIDLLRLGIYAPRIPEGEFRDFLLQMRRGEVGTLAPVIEWAENLEVEIEQAYETSTVRTEPDMERVNAFLLRVRKEMWA